MRACFWRAARGLLVSAALTSFVAGAWSRSAEPACPPAAQPPTEGQLKQAMASAQDHGFLWRISKGGHSSYLYGTIHVGKLAWAFPGPALTGALKDTDSLALELDPLDPAMGHALNQVGPSALVLPPELARRLERQRRLACVDAGFLAGMHPVMRAVTLSVLAARGQGLDPAWGQEVILAGQAHATQRTVVSLESAESQLKALIPDDPEEARAVVADTLRQLEQSSLPVTMRHLADTWAQGKLADLADYERWCDCMGSAREKAFMRRLLDDRNPHLAEGIDALHKQGSRVLAAVGALHMIGPKGLPGLLEKMGYTLERLH